MAITLSSGTRSVSATARLASTCSGSTTRSSVSSDRAIRSSMLPNERRYLPSPGTANVPRPRTR